MKSLLIIFILTITSMAESPSIISKNKFFINNKIVKMEGDFIIISLKKGLGYIFFIKNNHVIIADKVTGGTESHKTPYGYFPIISKTKFHMSNLYPDPSGINNMDDMLRLTNDGIAIHKGSISDYSHGCIHVDPSISRKIFDLSKKGLPVIITNEDYSDFI